MFETVDVPDHHKYSPKQNSLPSYLLYHSKYIQLLSDDPDHTNIYISPKSIYKNVLSDDK